MQLTNHKRVYFTYVGLLLISFIFLFFFSKATSPFYGDMFYGGDSAIFVIMGQMFLDGKMPYVEFFDHKGPVIIFIEAFAQCFIYGKTGVFFLQIVNMFFILIFIYKTAQYFTTSLANIGLILVLFLTFFGFSMVEGNLTEEYSLLYTVISIYVVFRFYYSDKQHLSLWIPVVMGLCFVIPFWMRANNASVVCACITFIFFLLCKNKNWKALFKFTTTLVLSVVLLSLSISAYFIWNGTFEEMIYVSFLYNLNYAINPIRIGKPFMIFMSAIFMMMMVLLVGCYFLYKKDRDKNIVVFSILLLLIGFPPLCLGHFFYHYLDLLIPVFLLGIMFFLKSERYLLIVNKLNLYAIVFLVFGSVCNFFIYRYHEIADEKEFAKASRSIIENVSELKINNVFCYMVPPQFYLATGVKPFYKYFIWQEPHERFDHTIFTDVNQMIVVQRPVWVLVGTPIENVRNKTFKEIILKDYILHKEVSFQAENRTQKLTLYRLGK